MVIHESLVKFWILQINVIYIRPIHNSEGALYYMAQTTKLRRGIQNYLVILSDKTRLREGCGRNVSVT